VKVIGAVFALCAAACLVAGAVAGAWGRTSAGNTALIVPFGFGPAAVAAGWVWLALDGDIDDRSRMLVSVAGFAIATLVLALLSAVLPPLTVQFGAPPLAGLVALAIPLVLAAPTGNALAARHDRPHPFRDWGAMPLVVALLLVLLATPAGAAPAVAPLLVPVVMVAPLAPNLDRTGVLVERIVGGVLLPVVVAASLLIGMALNLS